MTRLRFLATAFLMLFVHEAGNAQAWAYPSFQPPRIAVREYNFGVADADSRGITLVFQWREQSGPRSQFSFDLGIADTDRRDTDLVAFGGVAGAMRVGSSTQEVPLDFVLTGGLYLAIGDGTLFRLPVGVSMGHRFDFDGGLALTPYLHPRVSLDVCNSCGGSDLSLTFDLGMNFEVSRTLSIRGAALFTGTESIDGEGFGISLAWTPPSLARRR
jgi:hypothetical protein